MAKEYVAGNGNFKSAIDFDTLNARFFDNAQEIDIANYVVNSANQQKSKDDLETVRKNEEKEEEAKSNFAGMVEKIESDREEAERKAQEERAEAWANSEHTYAGQTMSAPQWLATIDWFQDEDNVAAWESEMAKRGIAPNSIRSIRTRMNRLDELILKESRGELLTTDEKREMETLSKDKDVQKGYSVRNNLMDLDQSVTNAANVTHGTNSISQGTIALEIADSAQSDNEVKVNIDACNVTMESNVIQISTSISKSIDGVENTSGLTASFNQNAEGVLVNANNPTPTNNKQPIIQVAANFDASTGMI